MSSLPSNMKKTALAGALAAIMGVTSMATQAALPANATLSFIPNTTCAVSGTYPNCKFKLPAAGAPGSYFDMADNGQVVIQSNNGIVLGQDQPASGTHSGTPNGSESPDIDQGWAFFGNAGLHQTLAGSGGITIINNTGAGGNAANVVTLDFSAWNVTWNGIASIPMNARAHSGGTDGVAVMTCTSGTNTCLNGEDYTLVYYATVPAGDPSGFGGVQYSLFMGGSISTIETPTLVGGAFVDGAFGGAAVNKYIATATLPEDTGYTSTGSTYDFKINCGGGACSQSINLHIPSGIPANAVYRKYTAASGWLTFTEDGNNIIQSGTRASNDNTCQNASDYAAGLIATRDCIRLTMRDGDANDADGDNTNGIIVDPGHVAVGVGAGSSSSGTSGTSGCTLAQQPVSPVERADWWLLVGFMTWLGIIVKRKQQS